MVGGGDLGEDAVELLHGGRVADEVAHAGAGAEAVAEEAGFDVERAALGGALEGGGELFEGEGLGEIVAGTDAHGLDCGVDGGEGGHDDDDGLGMLDADVFEQREAAAAGDLEVEQEDVDGAVREGEAGGGDGLCGLGDEAEAGGDLGAGVADGAVVVDDQDAELGEAVGVDAAREVGREQVLGPLGGAVRLCGASKRGRGIGQKGAGFCEHVAGDGPLDAEGGAEAGADADGELAFAGGGELMDDAMAEAARGSLG